MKFEILPEKLKTWFIFLSAPLVDFFIRINLHPNFLTAISLVLGACSGYLFGHSNIRLGGILFLLSGLFDMIDGRVARSSNQVTKFGALFDSTLDRYSEVFVFFGLAYHFISQGPERIWVSVAVSVALAGSIMVSYVRARAEGLGFSCKVGIMQRPERIVLVGFSAIIHEWILIFSVMIIAILANLTAIQRLYHIWIAENGKKSEKLPINMHYE